MLRRPLQSWIVEVKVKAKAKAKILLRPLRGDRRIPFGFRHVLLEAVSVESSGVSWSTANYVELILNFNKSMLAMDRTTEDHCIAHILLLKFKISSRGSTQESDFGGLNGEKANCIRHLR